MDIFGLERLDLNWFINISILVMLLLLYNYIPERVFFRRGILYSVFVGIIFSFAAIIGFLIAWEEYPQSSTGMNAILIPLAGLVGGPVSAVLITFFLLLTLVITGSGIGLVSEILIFAFTALIGSFFYYLKKFLDKKHTPGPYPIRFLLVFSVIIALVTYTILFFFTSPTLPSMDNLMKSPTINVFLIITVALFVLGILIHYIDQKRQNEAELITHRQNLEKMVAERTADLELMSALHNATIESTRDGIVVMDFSGTVRSHNRAAAGMLGIPEGMDSQEKILVKDLLMGLVTDKRDLDPDLFNSSSSWEKVLAMTISFLSGRIYDLTVTPQMLNDRIIGRVINFRDITDKERAKRSLTVMNQKMKLLSDITRHDILNQVTALHGYNTLVTELVSDPKILEYLQKIDLIVKNIQFQAEFSRDYQEIGLQEPAWIEIHATFHRVADSFADKDIKFPVTGPVTEIYCDPLLERVFYNLIDNSVRHGEYVSEISLEVLPGNSLIIRYEDNGSGVAPEEKEKIFQKGHGKNTGLGMFLIREILSITGITITENGIYGEGVRFDILVPPGVFRFRDA